MTLALKLKYAFRHAMKRNPLVPRWCADLSSRERADPVVHLARQRWLVTQLLAKACDVPAYECRAALPSDMDPLDYLREAFPILDKAEVLQRPSSFLRKGRVPPHRLMVAETSGTTARRSTSTAASFHALGRGLSPAALALGRLAARRQTGGVARRHRGPDRAPPAAFLVHGSGRRPAGALDPAPGSPHRVPFISELQRFGATQLRAYPSAAYDLAAFAEEAGVACISTR